MRAFAISLGLALAATACTVQSEEDQLENAIRNQVAGQGNVLNVEMTRQDENNFTGFAEVRDNQGRDGRFNCTAQRTGGSNFQFNCLPAITDQIVEEMEGNIRTFYQQRQIDAFQVDLTRQDDMRMNGYAMLRDRDGTEIRVTCTAIREAPASRQFSWQCNPE